MSSILKALRKLEQNPNGVSPAIDFWQRKTDPEKAFGRGTRSLRPRAIVFCVLFVPLLAIGGWLLLKYAPLPAGKSQPGQPMPKSAAATAKNIPARVAPVPAKTDLEPKTNSPSISRIKPRREIAAAGRTGVATRTGERVAEKKGGELPAIVNAARAKTQVKRPADKLGVASRSFQPSREPIRASDSPSQEDLPVLNNEDEVYPPPVRSYQPRGIEKPAAGEGPGLTGFSVQAIAWSKIPAERIAVINGVVIREGGFVEGMQVTQIGMDEVSLKKGDKTWLLQFGR